MSGKDKSRDVNSLEQMIEKSPDQLAEKIAHLDDDSIIMVSLIREVGEITGFFVNEKYRSQFSTDRKKYGMIAARLAVGFGAALATDKDGMVSETEAVAIIRRSAIHYYTKIPNVSTSPIVAVWFNRDQTNITAMSDQIRKFFSQQS
jgi:hypothetical protein